MTDYIEQDCGYETPCWVWQHGCDARGYGKQQRIKFPGEQLAHRIYYRQFVGPIPDGMSLDHLCRNHSCVNPSHLEPVTHAENVRRGANAKLSVNDVRDIKYRLSEGESQPSIAADYPVDVSTINNIATGYTWKGVA